METSIRSGFLRVTGCSPAMAAMLTRAGVGWVMTRATYPERLDSWKQDGYRSKPRRGTSL